VLVIQRRDNGRWEAPGRLLERDEPRRKASPARPPEETGVTVEVDGLTGVYKIMTRAIVALVYRCHAVAGTAQATTESVAVDWISADDVAARMSPAYAVRVLAAHAGTRGERPDLHSSRWEGWPGAGSNRRPSDFQPLPNRPRPCHRVLEQPPC
jgi:8-oxo-dGTP diphosphatase